MSEQPKGWRLAIWLWPLLCAGMLSACGESPKTAATALAIRGVDLSMLERVEETGSTFSEGGQSADAMRILQRNGANLVRLRLWVDPQDAAGKAYGGGNLDLPRVMRLAQRAKALKLPWLLDLQYSDFWTDPGKQFKPRAWASLSDAALVKQVHDYSQQVLATLLQANLAPDYVQVGNEINSGLLWPTGKNWADAGEQVGGFAMLAALLNAGIQGIRDAEQAAGGQHRSQIILHLAKGTNSQTLGWWFEAMQPYKLAFDIIGLSYYPYWDGSLDALQQNIQTLSSRYDKPILIVETAYAFTTENGDRLGNNFGADSAASGGFPATPQGQQQYLQALRKVLASLPDGKGLGYVYWAPDWLRYGGTWATFAGMQYLHSGGNVGNAWENQALFDFNGEALPAIKELGATR